MADTQLLGKTLLTHTSHTVIQEGPKGSFLNIVAIIGFIIPVTVVIWGLINLAGVSRNCLSSLFGSKSAAAIEVIAPG